MTAYFVAVRNAVRDPDAMATYGELAGKSLAGHPVTPLAFYGKTRATDGPNTESAVIVAFPTFADAEAWYDSPAYQEALSYRLKGADYQTFIIQGID
ncbi:hypothetical protein C100_22885 [Sphingobium sp. C100]|jgi:uncharacterized protein (DUF1330 family)|uniref:DUF1330 domain-containing protein n=1 Tax=Sphingobium sp. C100 TaxID=1207055 RepID=UPI0003D61E02|nr:DUF1330 domain-containing protein [Sphingobium sp. C100]ETI58891.1 hypothetical protein C100_22885 [Sphingobium sp. C100]